MIYLNNAGAGIMSDEVIDLMISYFKFEQKHGARFAAKTFEMQINDFYTNVCKLINAESVDEIAFVDSSSRAINLIINDENIHKGEKIITLSSEFGTTLLTLKNSANKVGAEAEIPEIIKKIFNKRPYFYIYKGKLEIDVKKQIQQPRCLCDFLRFKIVFLGGLFIEFTSCET